jgi:hypothetical protein
LSGALENTHDMPAGQAELVQSMDVFMKPDDPEELDELEAPEAVATFEPHATRASGATRSGTAAMEERTFGSMTRRTILELVASRP